MAAAPVLVGSVPQHETYSITSARDIELTPQGSIKKEPVQAPRLPTPTEVKAPSRPGRGRKSKIDAAAKIALGAAEASKPLASTSTAPQATINLRSAPIKPIVQEIPNPSLNPARKAMAAKRAAPLDFSALRTTVPRDMPQRTEGRLFGLPHCPVFYPTVEEFSSPMEYIERVAKECADDHGIAKVVPPEGWAPPFSLDSETFRFKTRLQRLNSMEASARASLNFLEQLYLFHRQQGNSKVNIPTIGDKTVDLWRLRREVNQLGGYKVVSKERQWSLVAKTLGFDLQSNPSIGNDLKKAFAKIILPFELYVERIKISGLKMTAAVAASNTASPVAAGMASRMMGGSAKNDSPVTFAKVQEASAKLNEALNADASAEAQMMEPSKFSDRRAMDAGEACEICHHDHDHHKMLLCDDCDRAYHMKCLSPPVTVVPKGDWICDGCIISTGADYGFETGREYSLEMYRTKVNEFKRRWIKRRGLDQAETSSSTPSADAATSHSDYAEELRMEDRIEREFWRLTESQTETIEIEYGADLHSSKYGSGFPSLERNPLDPYSRDGWNLNNLPILNGSLLRYVRSDIAGMTNPWLYAGMVFSTFAWHKEDHYTYSVNYHHLGETKTWYGAPAEDDHLLEETIRNAAPELFEQQPDLMFQLVTLMSPGRLAAAGVRLSACDQRPGEFVITFPQAYHSGFNHGFNICEAVNVCLPDWLPHGLACTQHYKELHRLPVFSHDELLMTLFANEKNPRSSKWLYPFFKEMIEREMERRQEARETFADLAEELDDSEISEDQYQCIVCKSYSFLSQIVATSQPEHVTCHEHATQVFGEARKTLRLRYSDDVLRQFLTRVKARSDKMGRQSIGGADEGEARKSGRVRIPTLAALEAAGEDAVPLYKRKLMAQPGYDESSPNKRFRADTEETVDGTEDGSAQQQDDDQLLLDAELAGVV